MEMHGLIYILNNHYVCLGERFGGQPGEMLTSKQIWAGAEDITAQAGHDGDWGSDAVSEDGEQPTDSWSILS